jgi:hypothetical protein
MKRLAITGFVFAAAALVACGPKKSSAPDAASAPAAAPSGSGSILSGTLDDQTVAATATVDKIDQKTRHVTLKRPDGSKFTIVASPEVRNLAQVKKGDVIKLEYRQSVAYEVNKAGTANPGVSATTDVTRAEPGAKPGGSVTDTVTVRMTITAINKGASEATLLGPDNVSTVVKVRDPKRLDLVEVGDVVDLTYTEALAVSVEKSAKR